MNEGFDPRSGRSVVQPSTFEPLPRKKTNLISRSPATRLMMEGLVSPPGSLEVVQVELALYRMTAMLLEA